MYYRMTKRAFRPNGAWFSCDRCSQRWRRWDMCIEWTNLRVCPDCLDQRPPTMSPPDVYPEGQPFPDARPPQDEPDRMQDDSYVGWPESTVGQVIPGAPLGALSPRQINGEPIEPGWAADDISIITGPVPPPSVIL